MVKVYRDFAAVETDRMDAPFKEALVGPGDYQTVNVREKATWMETQSGTLTATTTISASVQNGTLKIESNDANGTLTGDQLRDADDSDVIKLPKPANAASKLLVCAMGDFQAGGGASGTLTLDGTDCVVPSSLNTVSDAIKFKLTTNETSEIKVVLLQAGPDMMWYPLWINEVVTAEA